MASTISAGTTAGTALNIQSDTTGNLAFKTGAANVTAMTLDANQNVTFANNVTYTGTITATTFSGSGSGLTSLNASNVSTGTLSTAVLPTTGVNASTITTGTLAVAQGGTGLATLTANNVLIGNGTGNVVFVAPGSNGNVLTSNGTTWTSVAAAGGVTSLNGSTGALNGMTYISSGSFGSTAVSNNYITGLPSGYAFFKIFFTVKFNGVDGNGGGLALRLSKDNGSNYQTSGYSTGQLSGSGAGTDSSYASVGTGQNKIWICNTPGSSSNTWVNIDITIFNAQGTNTVPPSVLVYASGMSNGGDYCYINMAGGNNSNITANQYINAVQLFIDSGSSKQMNGGYYYVYGMK